MEITLKFCIEKRLQCFGTNELRRKKIYNCLDNKNDNYYHLITARELKREASWIHLFHFNDNLNIQSSFKSKPKFSAIT